MPDQQSPPLVSIVIPTKDRLGYLRETLASVVAQTHRNWEAIVVDDGSSDGTLDFLRSETARDSRIKPIFRTEHRSVGGAQVCRNLGLSRSCGAFILFLDSDDLLAPHCLAGRLQALRTKPNADFVVGQCQLFERHAGDCSPLWAKWHDEQDDLDAFLGVGGLSIPWQTSGPLWRRAALDRVGPWDEELSQGAQDWEYHVRALCLGSRHFKIPDIDYYWRRPRDDSMSSFEAFKRRHASGGLILAYQKNLAILVRSGRLTPPRHAALRREAVRLASLCRLHGGSLATAAAAITAARAAGLLPLLASLEIRLALTLWPLRLGPKIPSLAWLNRRYRLSP